jgi:deoxyribonuclease-4
MLIGFHVSIAGSIDMAVDRAIKIGCTTFQIFTRNPRGWTYKNFENKDINNFTEKCRKNNFKFPIAHMPYISNISSSNNEIYNKSKLILTEELERCGSLNIPYLVTHLGSHLGRGEIFGLNRVIKACNNSLSLVNNNVTILLENTAGTKNSVGSTFENLNYVINNITSSRRVGICFDTAHAFAAGYDFRGKEDVNRSLSLFNEIIGLDKIKVIHLNDSKFPFNSHSDRHEHIGLGHIGENGFQELFRHKFLNKCPIILETPIDSQYDDVYNLNKVKEIIDKNRGNL